MWLLRTFLIAGIALIVSAAVVYDIESTKTDERLTAKFSEGPITFTFTVKEKFIAGHSLWIIYLTEDNESKSFTANAKQYSDNEVNDVVTIQVDYADGEYVYRGDTDYIGLLPSELRNFFNIPKLPLFLLLGGVFMLWLAKVQYEAGYLLGPRVVME